MNTDPNNPRSESNDDGSTEEDEQRFPAEAKIEYQTMDLSESGPNGKRKREIPEPVNGPGAYFPPPEIQFDEPLHPDSYSRRCANMNTHQMLPVPYYRRPEVQTRNICNSNHFVTPQCYHHRPEVYSNNYSSNFGPCIDRNAGMFVGPTGYYQMQETQTRNLFYSNSCPKSNADMFASTESFYENPQLQIRDMSTSCPYMHGNTNMFGPPNVPDPFYRNQNPQIPHIHCANQFIRRNIESFHPHCMPEFCHRKPESQVGYPSFSGQYINENVRVPLKMLEPFQRIIEIPTDDSSNSDLYIEENTETQGHSNESESDQWKPVICIKASPSPYIEDRRTETVGHSQLLESDHPQPETQIKESSNHQNIQESAIAEPSIVSESHHPKKMAKIITSSKSSPYARVSTTARLTKKKESDYSKPETCVKTSSTSRLITEANTTCLPLKVSEPPKPLSPINKSSKRPPNKTGILGRSNVLEPGSKSEIKVNDSSDSGTHAKANTSEVFEPSNALKLYCPKPKIRIIESPNSGVHTKVSKRPAGPSNVSNLYAKSKAQSSDSSKSDPYTKQNTEIDESLTISKSVYGEVLNQHKPVVVSTSSADKLTTNTNTPARSSNVSEEYYRCVAPRLNSHNMCLEFAPYMKKNKKKMPPMMMNKLLESLKYRYVR